MDSIDISGIAYNGTMNNFDPDSVVTSESVLITLIIDKSYSIAPLQNEIKNCIEEYVKEMRNSHHSNKILMQMIFFGHEVEVQNGYRPISEITSIDFVANGGSTCLYDAVYLGMQNALNYQNLILDSGCDCKNIIFIVTDGEDNASKKRAKDVKELHEKLMKEEVNMGSFTSILVGVGRNASFKIASDNMGIMKLKEITDSAKDIREVIGLLSASTSSVAAGGNITF